MGGWEDLRTEEDEFHVLGDVVLFVEGSEFFIDIEASGERRVAEGGEVAPGEGGVGVGGMGGVHDELGAPSVVAPTREIELALNRLQFSS